jgi:hypothetical protein
MNHFICHTLQLVGLRETCDFNVLLTVLSCGNHNAEIHEFARSGNEVKACYVVSSQRALEITHEQFDDA